MLPRAVGLLDEEEKVGKEGREGRDGRDGKDAKGDEMEENGEGMEGMVGISGSLMSCKKAGRAGSELVISLVSAVIRRNNLAAGGSAAWPGWPGGRIVSWKWKVDASTRFSRRMKSKSSGLVRRRLPSA